MIYTITYTLKISTKAPFDFPDLIGTVELPPGCVQIIKIKAVDENGEIVAQYPPEASGETGLDSSRNADDVGLASESADCRELGVN
jgi:hypothetical protein